MPTNIEALAHSYTYTILALPTPHNMEPGAPTFDTLALFEVVSLWGQGYLGTRDSAASVITPNPLLTNIVLGLQMWWLHLVLNVVLLPQEKWSLC